MTYHGKFGHLTDPEFVSQMRARAGASPVIAETLARLESNLDSSAKAAEDLKLLVETIE